MKAGILEFTAHQIDNGLKSARLIILTVNIICAFLFLVIFEVLFGWQSFRPGASRAIYENCLAELAATHEDSLFTPYDSSVHDLAKSHVSMVIGDSLFAVVLGQSSTISDKDKLMKLLSDSLGTKRTWEQEERLKLFAIDVQKLLRKYGRQSDGDNGNIPLQQVQVDSALQVPPKEQSDSHQDYSARVSFLVQEILDRFRVNESTHGRRVDRRDFVFPVTGTVMQIEDLTLPIAIFLLLLSYWMYTAFMRVFDTVRGAIEYFQKALEMNKQQSGGDDPSTKINGEEASEYLKLIINAFHFMRLRKVRTWYGSELKPERHHPIPELGVLWLFSAPFLMVSSSILINLHEFSVFDVRWHDGDFLYESSIARAYLVRTLLEVGAAIFLWRLAFRTGGAYIKTHSRLAVAHVSFNASSGTMSSEDDYLKRDRMNSADRVFMYLYPTTLGWIAASPFVFIGSYSMLSTFDSSFLHEYFIGWTTLGVYLSLLTMYAIGFHFVMSRRSSRSMRFFALGSIFCVYPLTLIGGILTGLFSGGYWIQFLVSASCVVGLVLVGIHCRVYHLLLGASDEQMQNVRHWRISVTKEQLYGG